MIQARIRGKKVEKSEALLPKWAQDEIQHLRNQRDSWKERALSTGQVDPTLVSFDLGWALDNTNRRYLPDDITVSFLTKTDIISVRLAQNNEVVEVHASHKALTIQPHVSNSVTLRAREWNE